MVGERIRNSGVYAGTSSFIAQALLANTLDEATTTDPIISAEKHLDERMRFVSCLFADSDLEGALPFYALVDVVRDNGDGVVEKMSCGGTRVVATLLRAVEMGWFPFEAKIVSVDIGGSKTALNLVPVPAKVANTAKK